MRGAGGDCDGGDAAWEDFSPSLALLSSSLVSPIVLSSPISSPAGCGGVATAEEAVQIKQPPEISLAAFVAL